MFTQDRPVPSNHISFHMINPHEVSSYIMIHHDTSWYIIISVPFVQSTELQVFFSNFLGPKNHLWRIQYFNRRGANNVFKKYQWNSSRPSLLACMVRHPTFLRVQGDECHNVSRYIYSMFGEYLETWDKEGEHHIVALPLKGVPCLSIFMLPVYDSISWESRIGGYHNTAIWHLHMTPLRNTWPSLLAMLGKY